MHREDKKFTHNSRIFNNSWYLLVDQSNESNTKNFPSFGCIWNAIQWFMQKKIILCTFCRHGSEQWFIMKWLILDLQDVVWGKYDIYVFPSCHHMRYAGLKFCEGLLVKYFLFLLFFLLCFKCLYGRRRPSSIMARHAQTRKSPWGQGIRPFSLKE